MASDPIADRAMAAASQLGGKAKTSLRVLHPSAGIKNIGDLPERWEQQSGCALEFLDPVPVGSVPTIERFNRTLEWARDNPGEWDVFSTPAKGLGDLVEEGVVRPIDDYTAEFDPGIEEGSSGLLGALRLHGRYGGKRYGLPLEASYLVCYYRADLVADAQHQEAFAARFGYRLAAAQTWDQMLDQVRYFHEPQLGFYGFTSVRRDWSYFLFLQLLYAEGGAYFDSEARPTIATDHGLAAMQRLRDLAEHSPLAGSSWDWPEWYDSFCGGHAFATVGWPSLARFANSATSGVAGKVGYCLPVGTEGQARALNCISHTWVVADDAANPELAYLWAQWHTSPRVTADSITGVRGTLNPSRRCHFDNATIVSAYTPAYIELGERCLESLAPELNIPRSVEYLRCLNDGVVAVSDHGVDPEAALSEVAMRWSDTTSRCGRANQARSIEMGMLPLQM